MISRTGRIVSGLTDPTLKSGIFYGSGPQTHWTRDEQSEIFPDLANEAIQQHADRALHRFLYLQVRCNGPPQVHCNVYKLSAVRPQLTTNDRLSTG
jgi:hypothetical protein